MKNGQATLVSAAKRGIGREVVRQLAARTRSVEEGVNTPVWAVISPAMVLPAASSGTGVRSPGRRNRFGATPLRTPATGASNFMETRTLDRLNDLLAVFKNKD